MMSTRNRLVTMAAIAGLLAVLASLTPAPAQPRTFSWKVQSSFPVTDYPHRSLIELAKSIDQMSGGRLKIDPLPVGAVVGFFEVLDAVNRGALDGGLTWPGLWAGKNSAAGLFGSPLGGPFGMGQNEFTAWLFSGGGQELYNDLLQKELKMDVVAHFTTIQPFWEAFGWLKRPMNNLEDLKKLKFRSSGIGLEMFKRMGVSTVGMAGGDIVPALERGVIDGAEWAIPSRDIVMGFQQAAKYYYMPSFRQPPTYHELIGEQEEVGRAAQRSESHREVRHAGRDHAAGGLHGGPGREGGRGSREQARRADLEDAGRGAARRARGHRQRVRGGGAEESILREGPGIPAGVREENGGARAEDDTPDGHRRPPLLAEAVAERRPMPDSPEILRDRGKGLEDEFFRREDQRLIKRLAELKAAETTREALAKASGITTPAVLDQLVQLGIRAETLAALSVAPLVEVAWADGELDAKERRAIVEHAGVARESTAGALLEAWLDRRPDAKLLTAWTQMVHAMRSQLAPDAAARLKTSLLEKARTVAAASGGMFGVGSKVSKAEKEMLAKLEAAFG